MKKATYILIALSIIILSGCGNSPIKQYPRYIKQMNNIRDIVLASDYAYFNSTMDGVSIIHSSIVATMADTLNSYILRKLKSKGYVPTKTYDPTFNAFSAGVPIKVKAGLMNKIIPSNRSEQRVSKKGREFAPTINKYYFYNNPLMNQEIYSEIFPAKIDTNKKIFRQDDTVTNPSIDLAIFVLVRGVSVSQERQIAMALIGGGLIGYAIQQSISEDANPNLNVLSNISYIDIHLYLIDRKNNDVIWKDRRIEEYIELQDTEDILDLAKEMLDNLPRLKVR